MVDVVLGHALGTWARVLASGEELVAPELLWSEATSALHEQAWRGVVAKEEAALFVTWLARAPIAVRRPRELRRRAWEISDRMGWAKTYDAEYVALAQLLGCRLVTLDGRLVRGAARLDVVITPADL